MTLGPKGYSDVGTKLMSAAIVSDIPTSGFTQLIKVKSTSAKGGTPANIEITELDDPFKSNVPDRIESPNQTYAFNWNDINPEKLTEIQGKRHAFLEVLPSGDGYLFVGVPFFWHVGMSAGSASDGTLEIVVESMERKDKSAVTALIAE